MKPKLKPPGTKRLKLEYDGLLSNFGFKFKLRRHTSALYVLRHGAVGPRMSCLPRHRMPSYSGNERVPMTKQVNLWLISVDSN